MACQCGPDEKSRVGGRRGAIASPRDLATRHPRQYQETALFRPLLSEPDVPVSVASGSPTPERPESWSGEVLRMSRPRHCCQSRSVVCRPLPCSRLSLAPTPTAALLAGDLPEYGFVKAAYQVGKASHWRRIRQCSRAGVYRRGPFHGRQQHWPY